MNVNNRLKNLNSETLEVVWVGEIAFAGSADWLLFGIYSNKAKAIDAVMQYIGILRLGEPNILSLENEMRFNFDISDSSLCLRKMWLDKFAGLQN